MMFILIFKAKVNSVKTISFNRTKTLNVFFLKSLFFSCILQHFHIFLSLCVCAAGSAFDFFLMSFNAHVKFIKKTHIVSYLYRRCKACVFAGCSLPHPGVRGRADDPINISNPKPGDKTATYSAFIRSLFTICGFRVSDVRHMLP